MFDEHMQYAIDEAERTFTRIEQLAKTTPAELTPTPEEMTQLALIAIGRSLQGIALALMAHHYAAVED